MRVVDGMHRLMATSLRGRETIDVVFFEGSEADIFLRAVQENVAHGLPLTQADRRAAAERIIASHPHMSDRAIAQSAGLAAKTVAIIRKRSTSDAARSNTRVGRDGRVRPLDSSEGRRLAAQFLAEQPTASLRDVARSAGISPATVLDVRKRLERGESPVPGRTTAIPAQANGETSTGDDTIGAQHPSPLSVAPVPSSPGPRPAGRSATHVNPATTVEKLLRDPSLRGSEQCRSMLRLLHTNAVGLQFLPAVASTLPPHCVAMVVELARQYARMWVDFARELDGRARIIDPGGGSPAGPIMRVPR